MLKLVVVSSIKCFPRIEAKSALAPLFGSCNFVCDVTDVLCSSPVKRGQGSICPCLLPHPTPLFTPARGGGYTRADMALVFLYRVVHIKHILPTAKGLVEKNEPHPSPEMSIGDRKLPYFWFIILWIQLGSSNRRRLHFIKLFLPTTSSNHTFKNLLTQLHIYTEFHTGKANYL
jgi:hypothetical protein